MSPPCSAYPGPSTLRLVNQHLRSTGQSATRFGMIVARDPRLVHDMRAGRQPRPPLDMRIRAYLAEVAAINASLAECGA